MKDGFISSFGFSAIFWLSFSTVACSNDNGGSRTGGFGGSSSAGASGASGSGGSIGGDSMGSGVSGRAPLRGLAGREGAGGAGSSTDIDGDNGFAGEDAAARNVTAPVPRDGGAMDVGPLDAEENNRKPDVVANTPADGETSTPLLTLDSLTVTPLALNPQFSPGVHDYFVSCSTGTNALAVAATASLGATVRLLQPATSAAARSQNMSVELLEDQAIVLEVTALGSTDQYWVRCLPHDFPPISVTTYPGLGGPTPGWYLIANLTQAPGESSFAMAIDAHGTPVWYHRVSTITGALNVEVLERDTISFTPRLGDDFGTDPNGRYEIHELGASQVRYVQAVGTPTDHHELRLLPNGDALVISFALTPGVDLTGNGSFGPDTTIADCAIQEIDSTGNLVWAWLASDHFDASRESVAPEVVAVNGEDVVDTFHCNSIDVDADGNLLVSARHMNAVFLVNKQTGKVVWKMGGIAYNRDGAQLIQIQGDPETTFNRQHDARLQANGDVSLFDDHSDGSGPARGVEYAIDFASGTATVAWQYVGEASSGAMGSCRRYSDGNAVIGWGSLAVGTGAVLSEVDSRGNDVLDISFASGDLSYRAVKVTEDLVDLSLLRETAGLP